MIEAAAQVIERCPHVRFLFVGDGILRPQLEEQIARAGLSDYFRFTGLVDPMRIAPLIGAMDILVHASLREGLARAYRKHSSPANRSSATTSTVRAKW